MRDGRLLRRARPDAGTATVESVFAVVLLTTLVLGVVQVAIALYGRNVLISSAHEGARAAVEIGRHPQDGAVVAREVIERTAGGMIEDLAVAVDELPLEDGRVVRLVVSATVRAFGPLSFPIPVRTAVTATRQDEVR